MDLAKYLAVLVALCLEGGETGGGGKHHNHVKIHIPEFIHHDHHKKVITIHHHHHKPKKEHHHHHHHHHKPQIPHGHHYNHHHKKTHTKTHTLSKGSGHGHHGHHGHHKHHHTKHGHSGHSGHHAHHGHHGHHGHEHHGYGHHHDAPIVPTVSYNPMPVPSFEDNFGSSFSPAGPSFGVGTSNTGYGGAQVPKVHGVTHTVKQVKVYDSLPGALPNAGGSHGYEVTEEGEDGDDDVYTAVNGLHQTFPATFNYLRSAAPQPASHDPFSELGPQSTVQAHDPFAPGPTSLSGVDSFTATVQSDPFSSSAPASNVGLPSVQTSAEFPTTFQAGTGFDGNSNSFSGPGGDITAFGSNEESQYSEETPVTFAREAGIQESSKTGNVETIVY